MNEAENLSSAESVGSTAGFCDDVTEALKECEFALAQALRTDKIGWLQEEAHKSACKALERVRKAKSQNQ